jgi:hypothetical protein
MPITHASIVDFQQTGVPNQFPQFLLFGAAGTMAAPVVDSPHSRHETGKPD